MNVQSRSKKNSVWSSWGDEQVIPDDHAICKQLQLAIRVTFTYADNYKFQWRKASS